MPGKPSATMTFRIDGPADLHIEPGQLFVDQEGRRFRIVRVDRRTRTIKVRPLD